jgi:pilus assembly protein CpaF
MREVQAGDGDDQEVVPVLGVQGVFLPELHGPLLPILPQAGERSSGEGVSASPGVQALLDALADPAIGEVMLNEDGSAYVERAGEGRLQALPLRVDAAGALEFLRAVAGAEVDGWLSQRPYADLLAVDGARVHALAPPLVRALTVTIRKRPGQRPDLQQIVDAGTLSQGCAGLLRYAVAHRKNILLVGGTSSGKTTMLNALGALIPAEERILVLEDTPEITLPQPHVNYVRTRLRDPQGKPDVTLRELVANTLRMRPDRVLVGETRGPEAADMLQAMNVGQDGMMSTLHASSCREALQRLETLVMMAGHDLPLKVVRMSMATALDLIVFQSRTADGRRRIMQVSEVTGMDAETITMSDLFKVESRKAGGAVSFEMRPTGAMPRFYDALRQQGVEPPLEFFR